MYKIAVLASGGGSNFESVADAVADGRIPNSQIVCVVADRPAGVLDRAKERGISAFLVSRKEHRADLSEKIDEILENQTGGVDLIVLAGYLSIVSKDFVRKYKNRIINIHPSLIPSFCGMGMWGLHVHEAAIEYGVKVSGCTVHLVDEHADTGPIVLQRPVAVTTRDPKKLQEDILVEEHKAIVDAVAHFAKGEITVDGRCVLIKENK